MAQGERLDKYLVNFSKGSRMYLGLKYVKGLANCAFYIRVGRSMLTYVTIR